MIALPLRPPRGALARRAPGRRRPAAPLLAAALLPAVLALAGCSGLPALTPHERSGTAAGAAALRLAWSSPATQPDWVPADAARIRWVATTQGGADRAPAALRLASASPLPASCRPGPAAAAAITASWAPPPEAGSVRRCGNWAVVPVPGGYYGWTPAERDATG